MIYKVPCGRAVGHGDYCTTGWLCSACEEVLKLRERVGKLEKCLRGTAQTLAWQCFGECRGFDDGLLSPGDALEEARKLLQGDE